MNDVLYIETDIPPGMTIAEFRRSRPVRRPWWQRVVVSAGRGRRVA